MKITAIELTNVRGFKKRIIKLTLFSILPTVMD